jgi:Trk K+ transport system NAD-binding subunit
VFESGISEKNPGINKIPVPNKTSKYIQKKYTIPNIPENIVLGAIVRNDKIYIPDQYTEIQHGDELLLFSKAKNIELAEDLFI